MFFPKSVLILGSGALKIGQAGEFDYSGSQAIKALKEEGIKTILLNPNIATVQTSPGFADVIYFLPITPYFVAKVITQEKPEGILLSFGGQTALNCGLALAQKGVFKKHHVKVLGTPLAAIQQTESRRLFAQHLKKIGLKIPQSQAIHSPKEAVRTAQKIGYPVICRAGFSLGGQGSSVAKNKTQLEKITRRALALSPELLIEEYLYGWKEIEYEVVRDHNDNCIAVCNMENIDPMGIHTGESIVVAPSQTLNNEEFFQLRRLAIAVIRHFKIVGECNIQFALNPQNGDYRIIEVNARLSRSSALASKATGYPLAFIAAKLSLGFTLDQLKNSITQKTSAFFEPALDYLAIKMPRWDFEKFGRQSQPIGTEMQSVGEVMAIGRNFPETIQKAVRMLNQGFEGIIAPNINYSPNQLKKLIRQPNSSRLFQIAAALRLRIPLPKIAQITRIDPWFINELKIITDFYQKMPKKQKITLPILKKAKKLGFSDRQIADIFKTNEKNIREKRKKHKIAPVVKQIDTLAAEYPAQTNYLYCTYQGDKNDIRLHYNFPSQQIVVLGSGPYCIGSSVEFDWCTVTTVATLKKEGYQTIVINCNPETVSTDYDITDKLYFDELSYERILDILEKEKPQGIIVSVGGQIPNNLAVPLAKAKIKILGTSANKIDQAEDRKKFSKLLSQLKIDQPIWKKLSHLDKAILSAQEIGFPVIVRPSYVLSGKAMFVAYNARSLRRYLKNTPYRQAKIVISKFIQNSKEIEMDLVAQNGQVIISAISEHIENAGVHSGDASIVFPPQRVYIETIRRIKNISQVIVKALNITGPANIQFLAKNNQIKVIECNLRASRTFPFISKVSGRNFAKTATLAILGRKLKPQNQILDLSFVGVKVPQFSFSRLKGVDPLLRVEMASTGEAACLGNDIQEAYLKALLATGQNLPQKTVLISLGGEENKIRFLPEAKLLHQMGLKIFATQKTSAFLKEHYIPAQKLFKIYEEKEPNIATFISYQKLNLVVNITDPDYQPQQLIDDDYQIRRSAADFGIPLFTNLQATKLFVRALSQKSLKDLKIYPYKKYLESIGKRTTIGLKTR
ncbi:carbamoyl phosphate synthase large subunit [Candidatus Shapirobacteria bacterium CG09_land_8_20_14_0_10_38_17]|uniref:Carbamoyl phosphate synthase large subunit n=1 Tax=Candidatus Shapirobacteria bacterium CG09_land_8_20_14_0_10_38_17 TaxID=1974884 RepID=A0A2H0WR45_9BACT|nr:MAG: carbamoyl phosphate synthase large subunit [Candidatus Shapirobacteria bacterium CG09_land_8_20_14_0_10_38_17]